MVCSQAGRPAGWPSTIISCLFIRDLDRHNHQPIYVVGVMRMIKRMPVQLVSLRWIVVIVKNYIFSHTGAVEAVVERFVHYIIKFNQFCQNTQSQAKRIPSLFVHWKVQNVSLYHFFTGQNILGLRGRWVYSSNWHISISIETLSWSRSLHFSSAFCQILHSIDSKNCHSSYILVLLTSISVSHRQVSAASSVVFFYLLSL